MPASSHIALGFALLRGLMLAAGTVPWLVRKMRRADAEFERSLVLMVASRTILLGLGMLTLRLTGHREALAWTLLGDAALQLFDGLLAILLGKRTLAALPLVLCLLDGWAGITLLG
jgi:hypothetical protein